MCHAHFQLKKKGGTLYLFAPDGSLADQVEYPEEEPWIRKMFAEELGKRGLESLMPDEVYTDPHYKWEYDSSEEQGAVLDATAGRGL